MVNVYVCSLEEWLLRQNLLPCCKKLKNVDFTKRLEAATKKLKFWKIQSLLEAFDLNVFLYVLKKHLCEDKNEREIPFALYIRLEYRRVHTFT